MSRIKKMIAELTVYLQSFIRKGVLWIFGCSVFSQLCGFVSSIFVVRKLEKIDYGFYVDASNVYSYFAAFVGMGLTSAIIQYCSENRESSEKNGIYKYSKFKGTVFNILLSVIILCFSAARLFMGHKMPGIYLGMMCLQPFAVYLNTYNQIILRVKRKNKEYGIVHIVYSITVVIGNIILTQLWGVAGLIASTYIANMVGAAIGRRYLEAFSLYTDLKNNIRDINASIKKEIDKYALLCAVTNFSSSVLVLIDITVLNVALSDPEVLADYRIGSVIPSACMFIPSSLITFFYPQIVDKIAQGKELFNTYFRKLIIAFLLINGAVGIVLFIGAEGFIKLIYGEKYLSAVVIMRLLSVNFFISASFRRLFGNIIAALKKVHINLILSIVAGFVNIVLDVILINLYGSQGAAIATLIISCFISLLEVVFIMHYFRKILPE